MTSGQKKIMRGGAVGKPETRSRQADRSRQTSHGPVGELNAWGVGVGASITEETSNDRGNLVRFTQGPPVEYGRLAETGRDDGGICRRHFDTSALWLFAVLVDAARREEQLTQSELIRRAGFTKSTGRRLLHQLNTAGMLIIARSESGRARRLLLRLPGIDHAQWRLRYECSQTCGEGGGAGVEPLREIRTAGGYATINAYLTDATELEERMAEMAGVAGRLGREWDTHSGIRDSQDGKTGSQGGSRARQLVLGGVSVGEEGEERRDKRASGGEEHAVGEGGEDLGERYFPTGCPPWGDQGWFKNLVRRVGRENALAAVGQVNFQIDLGGEQSPRSPRGLATWLGARYAERGGQTGGELERRRHEARRREAVTAWRSSAEQGAFRAAGEELAAAGFFDGILGDEREG